MKRTSPSGLHDGRLAALVCALPLALACAPGIITPPTASTAPADGSAPPGAPSDAEDGSDEGDGEASTPPEPPPSGAGDTPSRSRTLRVDGRYLLDTCGDRFVVRGVEQVFGIGIDVDGSHLALVDEIAKSGANAVRALPNLAQLGVAEVDEILARIVSHDMVVFLSPGDRSWFARDDVQAMLAKYESWLVIDAFQEPNYDDRARWQADARGAIELVRGEGYDEPITVLANLYGRDLPSLIMFGKDIVGHDPLGGTILGWQAYWGVSGYYQGHYAMELSEAFATLAALPFPVQAGLDGFADPGEAMDYVSAMQAAHSRDVGWLWWDWYNPFGRENNLTHDGRATGLTALGERVVTGDANGLATARKACR